MIVSNLFVNAPNVDVWYSLCVYVRAIHRCTAFQKQIGFFWLMT